jgi:hypothetical protein
MTNPKEMLHVLGRMHGDISLLVETLEATAHVVAFCRDHAIDVNLLPSAIVLGYARDRGNMGQAGEINTEKLLSALQAFQHDVYNKLTPEQKAKFDAMARTKMAEQRKRTKLEDL